MAAKEIKCSLCEWTGKTKDYPDHVSKIHSAAPQQSPPPTSPQPPPPPSQAPGAPGAVPANVTPTAPPPPAPKNPFVNSQMLFANGGRISGRITGVRSAAGVRSQIRTDIPDRGGWLLDVQTDQPIKAAQRQPNGAILELSTQAVSARVTPGDNRHQTLWSRYGPNWLNQNITFRLPTAQDNTRAQWMLE